MPTFVILYLPCFGLGVLAPEGPSGKGIGDVDVVVEHLLPGCLKYLSVNFLQALERFPLGSSLGSCPDGNVFDCSGQMLPRYVEEGEGGLVVLVKVEVGVDDCGNFVGRLQQ